ncbi:MAG TPA: TetR/AcrR family transcriptional regulator [Steroidobacteraceae bacterium]|jgi:AcrR family transcriptional regulator
MNKTVARKRVVKSSVELTRTAHDDKRQEIIERCADLFDGGSYHRSTMQMLADEVGLGKPTLYHYFRSKTEILFAIHQQHIGALIDGLNREQGGGASPDQLLVHACRHILDEIARHPGYVRAFFEHYAELDEPKRAEIRRRRQEYFRKVCGILESGVAAGVYRECDIELTAYGFLGMCSWAYQWYPGMLDRVSTQELAETLCKTFLQGLNEPARPRA